MVKSKELAERVIELHKKQVDEMSALEKERDKALKAEKYDEMADDLRSMYCNYIAAGFTEEQAWKLTEIVVTNAAKK